MKPENKLKIIKKIVSKEMDIGVHRIYEKTRKREVVDARQLCMYFARKFTKMSLWMIGREIGNKDHATALHGKRAVAGRMEVDKGYRKFVMGIEKKISEYLDKELEQIDLIEALLILKDNGYQTNMSVKINQKSLNIINEGIIGERGQLYRFPNNENEFIEMLEWIAEE